MKNKGLALFWVDVANTVAFAGMLATGVVLKWVLPHGGGQGEGGGGRMRAGSAEWLGASRHEWGEIHFWISVAVVVLIGLHLALHTGWILASTRKYLFGWMKRATKPSGMALPARA